MENMRGFALLTVLLFTSSLFLNGVHAEENSGQEEGATLDILPFIDACISDAECNGERPLHFIEYFGADWCEPCKVLDNDLDDLINNETFVMRHHPSPQDLSYNSDSYQRFNTMYRLLFLPSLIHNGDALMTGTSQAQDLGAVMSNSTASFEGLNGVSIENGTIEWNSTVNGSVSIWRLGQVAHETEAYNHSDMVIGAMHFNASTGQGNISELIQMNGTGLVVMLESDGVRTLTVPSENPAVGFDLNEDEGKSGSLKPVQTSTTFIAVATTVVLLLLLAPALLMWYSTVTTSPSAFNEQE